MKDPHAPWAHTKWAGIRKGTHRETGEVRWRVYYRPAGGSQTSRTFETLDEARRFRTDCEQQAQRARDGRGRPVPRRTPTFGAYAVERFLPRYTGSTARMYRSTLKLIERADPSFWSMPVGLIRKGDVEVMLAKHESVRLPGRGVVKPGTINKSKRVAMTVLNHAADNEMIDRPGWKIAQRRTEKPQTPPSMGEMALLLGVLPPDLRAPVLVAACTGTRSGELRGLGLDDVDGLVHDVRSGWRRGDGPWRVHIRRQLGEGATSLALPKSSGSQRTVAVVPEVVDAVAAHLNEFGPGPVVDGVTLLWTGQTAGALGEKSLAGRLKTASKRCLGRELKTHTLRRFYATHMAYGGVPVHDISRDLGHADIRLTTEVYMAAMNDLADRQGMEARRQVFAPLFGLDAAAEVRLLDR